MVASVYDRGGGASDITCGLGFTEVGGSLGDEEGVLCVWKG